MEFFNFLKKKPKRDRVLIPLNEEQIKSDQRLADSQRESQALKSQLAKILAIEKEKRDKEKEIDKDSKRNKKLQEQEADLKAHLHGKIVKLKKFYKDVLKGKFNKNPIMITDKNGEVLLGQFGDFVFMEGGKIGIIDDKGELMSYGKNLHQAMYKPDGFENMVRSRQIRIPMDKDGNWMEDIEYKELPEPIDAEFDEEKGQIKRVIWSKVKTSEVKKIIANKMEQIHLLQEELERQDSVLINLRNKYNDLNRSMKVSKIEAYSSQSELSKSINEFNEMRKRMGELHMQLTKLTELKAMYESLIDKKDEIINQAIAKLDLTGEPKSDRLKKELMELLEWAKAVLPERVEITQEAPKPEPMMVQPGQILKESKK